MAFSFPVVLPAPLAPPTRLKVLSCSGALRVHQLRRLGADEQALVSASAVWKQPFRLPPHLDGTRSFAERENGLPIGARRVAEHGRRVAEHERNPPEHERRVAEHERNPPEHERRVAEHERNLPEHERRVAEHERNLPEHERKVAEHERSFPKHARSLRDHGRSLRDTRRRIADEVRNAAAQASGLPTLTFITAAGIAGSSGGAIGVPKAECRTANGQFHGATDCHASRNRTLQRTVGSAPLRRLACAHPMEVCRHVALTVDTRDGPHVVSSIMSATPSTMLDLGTQAPAFSLPDIGTANAVSLQDFDGKQALLVIFLCAHCPYVQHVAPELARIATDYAGKSVGIVGITSNDVVQYPQDAPEPTLAWAKQEGLSFPILFDESQEVAKAYTAACTPDFFLFGPDRTLVYRGQIDDSRPSRGADRPGRGTLNGREMRAAIDAVLGGQPVSDQQMPSIGCNIKWKAGNEPAYFG